MEWRLLEALTRHPGRLLTHRWLVTQVWDPTHDAETQTALRAHMRSLRSKLGDAVKEPGFVRTESGIGYRWIAHATSPDQPTSVPVHAGHCSLVALAEAQWAGSIPEGLV